VANLRHLLDDVDASEDAAEHSSRQGSQSNTQEDEAGLTSSEEDDENDSAGQRSMADFVQRTEVRPVVVVAVETRPRIRRMTQPHPRRTLSLRGFSGSSRKPR
jgi:hypothetical protein